VTGGPDLVKLLTIDCKEITGGILHVEIEPKEAADAMTQHIESNRKKLVF